MALKGKAWTPAQRRKFRQTIASRKQRKSLDLGKAFAGTNAGVRTNRFAARKLKKGRKARTGSFALIPEDLQGAMNYNVQAAGVPNQIPSSSPAPGNAEGPFVPRIVPLAPKDPAEFLLFHLENFPMVELANIVRNIPVRERLEKMLDVFRAFIMGAERLPGVHVAGGCIHPQG